MRRALSWNYHTGMPGNRVAAGSFLRGGGGGYVFELLSFSVDQMSRCFNLNNLVQNVESYWKVFIYEILRIYGGKISS